MKYKCLVLDHDDTVVNSTATIHFPCFVEYVKKFHPELTHEYTLDEYFRKNFHPGIVSLLCDEVGLSQEELALEEKYWHTYVKSHIPSAYEGMREIISEFRARGGIIAVSSHSFSEYIRRDYDHNNLPMPDYIWGWEISKEKRKPSPSTMIELMEKTGVSASEILVVDDSKPGYDMARAAGCDFAAALWAFDVPEIENFMKENCDVHFKSPSELYDFLFERT